MQTGPSPSEIRKARRLLVGAMVLAWATHLLVAQWAHGAEESPVKLVLRADVRVTGAAIRLGDVCYIEGAGSEKLAGRIVDVAPAGAAQAAVDVKQILRTVEEAGISPADVEVSGSAQCRVTFVSPAPSEADAESESGEWAGMEPDGIAVAAASVSDEAGKTARWSTLEGQLRAELAARLGVEPVDLALAFSARDEAIATLPAEGAGQVTLTRGDDLGRVAWEIEIDGESRQVTADASLTVRQLVAARPVARGQTLQATDLGQEAKTINRLGDRTPQPAEAIGAAAARDLTQGEVITAGKLAPRLLVERGQFVVVRVSRGAVEVRLMARAQESGGFGQVVRARNEQTGDLLYVTLTGPQAGVMSAGPTPEQ